jgi:hypothetical protein
MKPDEKTPRDWLLERRAAAAAQLEPLRRSSLPSGSASLPEVLREIFRPHRAAWGTLAVAWTALLLFHFSNSRQTPGRNAPSPSPERVAAWIAQFNSNEDFPEIDRLR